VRIVFVVSLVLTGAAVLIEFTTTWGLFALVLFTSGVLCTVLMSELRARDVAARRNN
jgi:hypothetical protein